VTYEHDLGRRTGLPTRLAPRVVVNVQHLAAAARTLGGPAAIGIHYAPLVRGEVGHVLRDQGATVRAVEREGLERWCREGERPCFSLERRSALADGRVAYRLRKPRRNGATPLAMTPVPCLARLAELVPPPRCPLLRFAGVLTPNSPWRAAVVPGDGHAGADGTGASPSAVDRKAGKSKGATTSPILAEHDRPKDVASTPSPGAATAPRTSLGIGIVPPPYGRIDWASLLRRGFLEDVLACPCGGRRRILAEVTEPTAVVALLEHLGLPARAPPLAAARDPGPLDAA
jgi:hypothetical protein